ncbi:uncharacterized protein LOC131149656 [Malania oleifera]|uniref:uncharacterized protein LOC131149656 n=1 Tax=Malania oleifera TaxID=397392 RepID=UPI0025ADCE83|nr:uncharacterized protein LOC131149656 [Malania oleifera]
MNFGFLANIPWVGAHSDKGLGRSLESATTLIEPPKQKDFFGVKLWGWSPSSIIPWAITAIEQIWVPHTVNKELKRRSRPHRVVQTAGENLRIRFRPYVSKVPWHTGPRAFLSQFFPRYGHYCGPNWSSGKAGGSPIWDRRPIDWLDFCCYCHDIGYDTHDQAELLKADLAFLDCLERPHMRSKGDAHVAHLYKTMCITGLRCILIPYRKHLLKVHSGQSLLEFGWLSNVKWGGGNLQTNGKSKAVVRD